jgi:hypothetical protein
MSGFAPIDASQNNLSRVGYGRDTPVTLHQNQRQLWGNARVSNQLKSDTVAVYFER